MNKICLGTLLCLLTCSIYAQNFRKDSFLPVSTPEEQGVSSSSITEFLNAANKLKGLEMHSFVMLRHGKLIAEASWKPYSPSIKHTLYSVSKSFTSTAVGLAIAEGKLKLTDKVASFFPDQLPAEISPGLAALDLRNLLTMTMGQDPEPAYAPADDWVKPALAAPFPHEPGKKFLYNNLGPFLLSAILQKVNGQKLIDYLNDRLFKPMDIHEADYEMNGQGINYGGYGLRLSTESMAKFGQLYLQKGKWKERQLVPEQWVTEATSLQIDQGPSWVPGTEKMKSDWAQGYGYLFWRCRHNAYRADGAMGQYIIVMPDQDAVIAITANTQDMQAELNLIWEYLLPGMHPGKLPANKTAYQAMLRKSGSLEVSNPGSVKSDFEYGMTNKVFKMEPNALGIESFRFNFMEGPETFIIRQRGKDYLFDLDVSAKITLTDKPGPSLTAGSKGSQAGLAPFKVVASISTPGFSTAEVIIRYLESVHHERYLFQRSESGNELTVEIPDAIDSRKKTVIKGKAI